MIPVLRRFREWSSEIGEEDYDMEIREEFYDDLSKRLSDPPSSSSKKATYDDAKSAWEESYTAILGKEKKRKRYEETVSGYLRGLSE